MGYREFVKNLIGRRKSKEHRIWTNALSHSSDYMRKLDLLPDDLEVIEREQGYTGMYPSLEDQGGVAFLTIELYGERFALFVKHACGAPYGGSWENVVMAVCITNKSLNSSTGHGTTLFTALPKIWHERVLEELEKNE